MIKELLVKNYKVILTGLMSGVLSFSMLTFINFMIGVALSTERTSFNYVHIALFIGILIGFVWARRSLSFQLIRLSQNLFWQLRMRVIKMILRSNYSEFDSRKDEIHSVLVHDINVLTNASLSVIEFIISSVVILSCLVYMGVLSWPLFLITLLTSGVGVFIYQLGMRKNNRRFQKTRDLENGFMKYFGNILNGFKEIAINPNKGNDIFDRKITPIAKDAFGNNTGAFVSFLNNQITGQVLFYGLIGSILLFFSVQLDIEVLVVINFLFILLYVLGALETIMVLLPGLLQARVSLNRIKKIEEEFIGELGTEYMKPQAPPVPVWLENIVVNDLYFRYENSDNEQVFEVGPINVDFQRGELVFIYGGNGSGKTTLILSLLGLLKPNSGDILLNGEVVEDVTGQQYRQLFSVVFNDFHLFDEFYGNLQFDQEKAQKYLELFEIESKVTITESGFSSTSLSTGQRKRLALIEAILENREIIVLDEWAADQDPYFRKKFYEIILPLLKQEGITVLLITHDDKYYDCCDKLLKMEYGKLIDESSSLNRNQALM